jgi:predicted DNA-binding protein with PD1-like motif
MKLYTFRLKPGQDLIPEIEKFVHANNIQAGFIVTCVAGLKYATLRMADALPDRQDIRKFDGPLEVVSLVGTVSVGGMHLHMAVANNEGIVFGGHLKPDSPVHLTAEIVIGEDTESVYAREIDEATQFTELVVKPRA